MISNLIMSLDKFWEVEHRPRQSLHQVRDEDFVDLKLANFIWISLTVLAMVGAVLFVGSGIL
jgi:hypothetical protein